MLEKAQANPDNLVYAEMLMWHVMQTKDFEMAYRQARAIDMRFENHEEERAFVKAIAQGLLEVKEGKVQTIDNVKKKLGINI